MRNKKPATATCSTCEKSDITSSQIALLKLNGTSFSYKCKVKNTMFTSNTTRFNRKNCGTYKGPGSGKEHIL